MLRLTLAVFCIQVLGDLDQSGEQVGQTIGWDADFGWKVGRDDDAVVLIVHANGDVRSARNLGTRRI